MKDNRKHPIKVVDGKVYFLDRFNFDKAVKDWEGRKAWITIGGRKNTRSTNQNAYYWGVVVDMLAKYLGYFPDEIHEVLKQKFLPAREVRLNEGVIIIPESTAKLDSAQFEDYLEKIRVWAATDLNFTIPLPNEDF